MESNGLNEKMRTSEVVIHVGGWKFERFIITKFNDTDTYPTDKRRWEKTQINEMFLEWIYNNDTNCGNVDTKFINEISESFIRPRCLNEWEKKVSTLQFICQNLINKGKYLYNSF